MKPRTTPKQGRSRGAVRLAAAELRAVNERQAHEGLDRLRADLLELERSSKTADDAFREAGAWDADDAEQLKATLRAARDAGGSKPPVAFRD